MRERGEVSAVAAEVEAFRDVAAHHDQVAAEGLGRLRQLAVEVDGRVMHRDRMAAGPLDAGQFGLPVFRARSSLSM